MNTPSTASDPEPNPVPRVRIRLWGGLWLGAGLIVLLGLLWSTRLRERDRAAAPAPNPPFAATHRTAATRGPRPLPPGKLSAVSTNASAIVAAKLARFAQSRRELALALARKHGIQVPTEVEDFFKAVESGRWEDIEESFQRINGGDSSAGHAPGRSADMAALWPAIIDAFGAAEQVHLWPAQKLLDYGNAVLNSLRPGMVYVGGTDNGRWIPELLNESGEGDRHVILTQNALADGSYMDYLRLQYDGQLTLPSEQEAQQVFADYLNDARRRLLHDQEHPDDPPQLRPGEEIRDTDGRLDVSGQVAVMAINERLLQSLLAKNPELSFALQESFPLTGTYAEALPLGPLMELRAADAESTLSAERASESLAYWRQTAQQVSADPEASNSETARKAYSHDAVAAANLLVAHSYSTEALEGYRLATQLWPGNPESTCGLASLLAQAGRKAEAEQVLADFTRDFPGQLAALQQLQASSRFILGASGGGDAKAGAPTASPVLVPATPQP